MSGISALFVIGRSGVMKYDDAPLIAAGPERDVAPSAALDLAAQPSLIPLYN